MNRPLVYMSAAWSEDKKEFQEEVNKYSRWLYLAGYAPICPAYNQAAYLNKSSAKELRDARDMQKELIKRSRIVVVCGNKCTDEVLEDIAIADKYRIPTTTIGGIMEILERKAGTSK